MTEGRLKTPKYREGDWMAVPLESGGYALGRIARKRGTAILLYAFGKRYSSIPTLEDTVSLKPDDTIQIARTGNLGIKLAEWIVIPHGSTKWKAEREQWPMPTFYMKDLISDTWWEIRYLSENPSEERYEQKRVTIERAQKLSRGGLYGHRLLTTLISKQIDARQEFIEQRGFGQD